LTAPGAPVREPVDWEALTKEFAMVATEALEQFIGRNAAHFGSQLAFAVGRIDDGRRVGEYLQHRLGAALRVLDVGAGNGGVAIAVACLGHHVHAVDIVPNRVFRQARSRMAGGAGSQERAPRCSQTVASASAIPYPAATFDAILCLETLEHIDDFQSTGREIMRVLKPGGICMVMTPARVKFLFSRDPHYGIPGLLLLPDGLQRFAATRVLRRVRPDLYDVTHTFWTLRGIEKLFPGACAVEPLFNRPRPENRLWRACRNLLWDRVVITKEGPRPDGRMPPDLASGERRREEPSLDGGGAR
jgi:2-polyprenyl-3-methyl-5-hydroxy-6-metoxy-1,4-benzoquinol methylase